MKRNYCLADKPFPVSAKAMRTLATLKDGPKPWGKAPAQCERLRRAGYASRVTVTGQPEDKELADLAFLTDAGRALLARGEP